MASDSEPRKFFEAPPEVTFQGIKMFFYCNFSTKTLANCNKAFINDGSCNFRGPFTAP